jgi:hypothetical protein
MYWSTLSIIVFVLACREIGREIEEVGESLRVSKLIDPVIEKEMWDEYLKELYRLKQAALHTLKEQAMYKNMF